MEPLSDPKVLRLNYNVYRRTSIRSTSSSTSPTLPTMSIPWSAPALSTPPQLVVLGLWPSATSEQIQYYTEGYAELYPAARLVLLHCSATLDRQVSKTLDALTAEPLRTTPDILLHLFGEEGATHASRLLRAYQIRTGMPMAVNAVIMDSVPRLVIPSFRKAVQSPQQLLALVYLIILLIWRAASAILTFWHAGRRRRRNQIDLNNSVLVPRGVRKCYIFEEADLMFSWCNSPVGGDDEIERQDFTVKRSSVDDKGRRTGDQERYWLAIENVWNGP